jgi:hypothetical protein
MYEKVNSCFLVYDPVRLVEKCRHFRGIRCHRLPPSETLICPPNTLHSMTTKKTAILLFTAVWISDLCLSIWSLNPLFVCGSSLSSIILPVVLYGCETWSLTLGEEHRLRVFENSVLRIFGLKRDEVTGDWRELHNEELHNLYSSPSIIRMIVSRRIR